MPFSVGVALAPSLLATCDRPLNLTSCHCLLTELLIVLLYSNSLNPHKKPLLSPLSPRRQPSLVSARERPLPSISSSSITHDQPRTVSSILLVLRSSCTITSKSMARRVISAIQSRLRKVCITPAVYSILLTYSPLSRRAAPHAHLANTFLEALSQVPH